jgi:hypothetical protein
VKRALAGLTLAVSAGVAMITAATLPAFAATSYAVSHATDPYSGRSVVVRWSPCQISAFGTVTTHYITYRVNAGGQSSRITLVKQALAQVTAATGLRFRYLGTTRYVPRDAVIHYASGSRYVFDAAGQRAATGAELVVAWAAKSWTNLLTGTEAGSGTASWSGSPSSQLRIVESAVVMKTGVPLLSGFRAGASVGTLLLHELGHAVGIEHVTSRSQVMYPTIGSWSPAGYASGDKTALRMVGRAAGCFRTSASAPANPAAIARAAGVRVTG